MFCFLQSQIMIGQGVHGMSAFRASVFRELLKPFLRHGPTRAGVKMPRLPGDHADIHEWISKKSKPLCLSDGFFRTAFFLAKYRCHRECLEHARAHELQATSKSAKAKAPDLFAYKVYVRTMTLMAAIPEKKLQPWLNGPGHNTSFHGGLVPWVA